MSPQLNGSDLNDPTYSAAAEQAVLGAVLADPTQCPRVARMLTESDFFRRDHQLIWRAIATLQASEKPSDVVTVLEHLRLGNELDSAGGFAYLGQLARETALPAHSVKYAEIVRSHAAKRLLTTLGHLLADSEGTPRETIAQARLSLREIECRLDVDQETEGKKPLASVVINDFLAMEIPPRKHLLGPVLPEQGLMMIHGPRGLGKTHMTVGICVAVASGGQFLRWRAPAPAGVLLVDGEMPASALQERLAIAIKASAEEVIAPLRIVTPDLNRDAGMPDLSTPGGQAAVDALVEDSKLIVLDNLSSLMRGVENDAESWQPLQTWALRHRAQGRSVLFIHHSGKGGAQRGTSRREDVLDTVIGLRRPSDYSQVQGARFEIHVEKGRGLYGNDAESFEAQLTAGPHGVQTWTMKSLEAGQDDRINELADLGMKPAEIAADMGIHKATVYRHLNKKSNGHA